MAACAHGSASAWQRVLTAARAHGSASAWQRVRMAACAHGNVCAWQRALTARCADGSVCSRQRQAVQNSWFALSILWRETAHCRTVKPSASQQHCKVDNAGRHATRLAGRGKPGAWRSRKGHLGVVARKETPPRRGSRKGEAALARQAGGAHARTHTHAHEHTRTRTHRSTYAHARTKAHRRLCCARLWLWRRCLWGGCQRHPQSCTWSSPRNCAWSGPPSGGRGTASRLLPPRCGRGSRSAAICATSAVAVAAGPGLVRILSPTADGCRRVCARYVCARHAVPGAAGATATVDATDIATARAEASLLCFDRGERSAHTGDGVCRRAGLNTRVLVGV
eukprot:361698-Chlamydomonas_euryale.AAC.5